MRTSRLFIKEVKSGNVSRVRHMLEDDPKLALCTDKTGLSAVMIAAYYRQSTILQLLRRQGSTLTACEAAAAGDDALLAQILNERPVAVNDTAADGLGLVHIAVGLDHHVIIDLLLQVGADVNRASDSALRQAPLHIATENGCEQCARILLAAGADPNIAQRDGWMPLHFAARTGNLTIARTLLEHGANPEALDERGRAPGEFVPDHVRDAWRAICDNAEVTLAS